MRIVVVGGSGQIGSRLCSRLWGMGHEVIDASPVDGIDAISGNGLAAALEGAQVVVDVSEAPSFDGAAALSFFRAASHRLMKAELAAGVRHHLLLSVVGADRLAEGGYFRAKLEQEALVKASGMPYTIVRSTQFMHFIGQIADSATGHGADNHTVRLPWTLVQPVDADELADMLAACSIDAPGNCMTEFAGPAAIALDEAVRRYLAAAGDTRQVVTDAPVRFFGAAPGERSLLPDAAARCGGVTIDAWLAQHQEGLNRERVRRASAHADAGGVIAGTDFAALRRGAYLIDPDHTRVLFSVSHFGFSTFYGEFARPAGMLRIDPARLADSRLLITVPVANIATGNRVLDGELRSADWLDSERYPAITLEGRHYSRRADGTIEVEAELTLHGVTRLVLLDVRFVGAGLNPKKDVYTAGFDVRGSLRRSDFGVDAAPLIGNELGLIIGAAFELDDGEPA